MRRAAGIPTHSCADESIMTIIWYRKLHGRRTRFTCRESAIRNVPIRPIFNNQDIITVQTLSQNLKLIRLPKVDDRRYWLDRVIGCSDDYRWTKPCTTAVVTAS